MTEFSFALLNPLMPEIFMAVAGLALLVLGVFHGDKASSQIGWLSAIAVGAVAAFLLQSSWERIDILNGMFVMDQFAGISKLLILGGLFVSIILSIKFLDEEKMARFEYPILMLFSGLGMMLMVSAHDLLALYMGLELQSLALYVLASIRRDNVKSSEAGLKYFVLGAISSGMLLFGASLVYGYTGSTNFAVIGDSLSQNMSVGALIGMVFLMAGLAFKISAVPFHMWTPDVYEGAPTSVTAFFAMVPKVAAIALITRLLFEAFPAANEQWQQIIWILSALSMAVGAFAALLQDNIKRLLAYSSIGNMGFALVGLAAGNIEGLTGVLVYMLIYMIMTAGTFGVVLSMRRDGQALEKISDLSGLSRNNPAMAYALAILMFSASGIPPLAGFFGKFMVFKAAVGAGLYGLSVFGVLCSVVAAYYYIRIIKVMFFDEPAAKFDCTPFARRAVVAASVAFILAFIFFPSPFVDISRDAVSVFFNG
jgi:NADH-quinone oxidoreductase subunit N